MVSPAENAYQYHHLPSKSADRAASGITSKEPRKNRVKRGVQIRAIWFTIGILAGMGVASVSVAPTIAQLDIAQDSEPATEIVTSAQLTALPKAKPYIAPVGPQERALTVGNGDTLMDMLTAEGIAYTDAFNVIESMRKTYSPRRVQVGQDMTLILEESAGQIAFNELEIPLSVTETIKVTRNGDHFSTQKIEVPLQKRLARAEAEIHSSLYETALAQGVPAGIVAEMIKAYSYDVDFQRDIKAGHNMKLVFEQTYTDAGDIAGHGHIKYAELELGKKPIRIYRFTDTNGDSGYYNEKGESIRKALLRTPINGARISSNFGKRRHPVLGYTKMHKGTDFAAATGTPIYAAGDGTIQRANRFGSYGNFVSIKHNGTYNSNYAHLHRFAKGIQTGKRVKQGDVIGYVGTTGRSTGPHLHYEITKNGKHVNPRDVKFKTGRTLSGKQLALFKEEVSDLKTQIATMPKANSKVELASLN